MDNKNMEELEKEYVKLIMDIRLNMIADESISDAEIQKKIEETPIIIKLKDRSSGTNLFMQAVLYDRMDLAKYLAEQGADIHYESTSDLFSGNALNNASTPEMAEWLLSLGLKIEKNLIQNIYERPVPYENPALVTAQHQQPEMMCYWLKKEKELIADEPEYLEKLFFETVSAASCSSGSYMLTPLISDDDLYPYLKRIYAEGDTWDLSETIKLQKRGLKAIEAEELQERKKELTKILNQRVKDLKNPNKEKLTGYIISGIKEVSAYAAEEYAKEDIYILSIEANNNNTPNGECSIGVYVNTEENHAKNLENPADDPWYYRFCEYEWYPLTESSEYYKEATEYLNGFNGAYERDTVYKCIVEAVVRLRKEGFFDSVFKKFVFISICASEVFDEEEMIKFVVKMNGKENCKDYIENIEMFF